ncbi:MAG TPA: hypothetical protein VFJ99_01755 [Solirubrobacterales bacterium]|nr:hypothetical protein [Solirubrobacterales bacterium]
MAPYAASAPLIAVNALASAIWVGGLVAIFVVARVASKTIDPARRVAFFRGLGRAYGILGGGALLVALASGAVLLAERGWDGLAIASAAVGCALLVATGIGIAQARAMTRLRRRALGKTSDPELAARVHRGAILAGTLRGAIGALTLTLVILASLLAGG